MSRYVFLLFLLLGVSIFPLTDVSAQDENADTVEILSPLPGEAVQGLAQIVGTVDADGFVSYTLEFSFQKSENWFPISKSSTPIINGVLGEWDTSLLADDNYNLRLTVNTQADTPIIVLVEGLRVRNYSSIETSTPMPTQPPEESTPTPNNVITATPTATPFLTPTPLPENQASVNPDNVRNAIQNGMIIGLILMTLIFIYQARLNKRK